MMDFVLKMMGFASKMMDVALKMMNFVLQPFTRRQTVGSARCDHRLFISTALRASSVKIGLHFRPMFRPILTEEPQTHEGRLIKL